MKRTPECNMLRIIAYREFCDVPRMFIVEHGGRSLLFDGSFDEEVEEYKQAYDVYELSNMEWPENWSKFPRLDDCFLGVIKVGLVQFDVTKRKQISADVLTYLS